MRACNITVPKSGKSGFFEPKNLRKAGIYAVVGILVVVGFLSAWYYYAGTRKIPSAGGMYFFSRLVLPVQRFAQSDPRWADDVLGPAQSTMAEEGWAVSWAAMV